MKRYPDFKIRFQRYTDGEANYYSGVESCDRCGSRIEDGDLFVHVQLWHRTKGYGELSLCSHACDRAYPLGEIAQSRTHDINAIAVDLQPEDTWVLLPMPPEYGGSIDWSEANSWSGTLGGETRYHGRYARDPDTMNMHGEKPLIPSKDADGLALADFSKPGPKRIDVSDERTESDLDLIFSAKPIDAHSQLESNDKKQLEG